MGGILRSEALRGKRKTTFMTLSCQAGAPVCVTHFVLSIALRGWALLLVPSYRWGKLR